MAKLNLRNIGVHKWNKTSEKLPPVGCYVLGYVDDVDDRCFAIVKRIDDVAKAVFSTNKLLYSIDEITHWMHLPNAPAQEETE